MTSEPILMIFFLLKAGTCFVVPFKYGILLKFVIICYFLLIFSEPLLILFVLMVSSCLCTRMGRLPSNSLFMCQMLLKVSSMLFGIPTPNAKPTWPLGNSILMFFHCNNLDNLEFTSCIYGFSFPGLHHISICKKSC